MTPPMKHPDFINIFNIILNKADIMILSVSASAAFIASYFYDITMNNAESFIAVISVVLLDGIFGILAGIKNEGFKTFKALKILKTLATWIIILAVLLIVERGFIGVDWLSEVIMIPFMIFQIISALKNASMAGYIEAKLLNDILDKIDKHKGIRKK